jgi:glutathione S-transferase
MAPVQLGYWDIRGLAQPIRLLLEYTGTDWEDKLYVTGPAPTFDKSCWFDEKFSHGFDFPNLPYLIDGDVKLTQTKAILKYIARKNDLVGKTEQEKIRIDLADAQNDDFRGAFTRLCYSPDFENLKENYLADLPGKLKQFSDFLGDNPWFAGQNLTYVDFTIYEGLDHHRTLEPNALNNFKNLQDFVNRFESLEKIAAYMKSPKFIKDRINNRMAKFGA